MLIKHYFCYMKVPVIKNREISLMIGRSGDDVYFRESPDEIGREREREKK